MYHLSNAWKSKKKRPIEFQFLFLQKEINIYCVYVKNQRVGAATKSLIWIIIECSDFQKITLWIFVCWGVTFFLNFGIQSLNNASKDYEKKIENWTKILSLYAKYSVYFVCML